MTHQPKKSIIKYHFLIALYLRAMLLLAYPLCAQSIVDMSGHRVDIPEIISKVYSTSPTSTYMVYSIDASLLVGINFDHSRGHNESSNLLDKHFISLPVIGGLQGGANSINRETLLGLHPDVVISWNTNASMGLAASLLQSSGIATVNVAMEDIPDIPKAYRFLGELLKRGDRTERLAYYADQAILQAQKVVEEHKSYRPVVYYAQGSDGLLTECDTSSHYQTIKRAGGVNPHLCEPSSGKGMEKITLEQVIMYNPTIIIAQEKEFVNSVKNDTRWRFVEAVKNNRVYLVPKIPFNWIDRPPSFMRLLGMQWLGHIFYNSPTREELEERMREFYALFLNVKLTQEQIQHILGFETQ